MVNSFGESGGKETSRVWHYTKGGNLPFIVESGVIRRAWMAVPTHRQRAVWGSTNPIWENSVYCPVERGRARIELKPEALPYSWKQYKKKSKIHPLSAKFLADDAHRLGDDARDWRVSFDEVPSTEWLSIEIFQDGQWRKWFGEVFIDTNWCTPTPEAVALFRDTYSWELVQDCYGNSGYASVSSLPRQV
jgi:hypothetical protein